MRNSSRLKVTCGWKLFALCTCGTCSTRSSPGLAGAGGGSSPVPTLVSPGVPWCPTESRTHGPHVSEPLRLSRAQPCPGSDPAGAHRLFWDGTVVLVYPKIEVPVASGAWEVSGATQGTCVCLSSAGRGPPGAEEEGAMGEQKPGGKGLTGEWVLRPIPDWLMNQWQLNPSLRRSRVWDSGQEFGHALALCCGLAMRTSMTRVWLGSFVPELVAAGTHCPCAGHGLGKAAVARWSPEGGRTAPSLAAFAAQLSPPRGGPGMFGPAARTGGSCELPASATSSGCAASPGLAAGYLPAQRWARRHFHSTRGIKNK